MKYNVQAIEFREEMLRNLGDRFTKMAEEIASKDKREIVSKEDMARAALLICKGYDREKDVKYLVKTGLL
jgi:histone H3/H4